MFMNIRRMLFENREITFVAIIRSPLRLRDYVQSGRQVLILTSSQELVRQLRCWSEVVSDSIASSSSIHIARSGGRTMRARPTWVRILIPMRTHDVGRRHSSGRFSSAVVSNEIDVNRDFDVAWHESQIGQRLRSRMNLRQTDLRGWIRRKRGGS